jgi:hypothetical protein
MFKLHESTGLSLVIRGWSSSVTILVVLTKVDDLQCVKGELTDMKTTTAIITGSLMLASPATFDIDGHEFHFDIPPGYTYCAPDSCRVTRGSSDASRTFQTSNSDIDITFNFYRNTTVKKIYGHLMDTLKYEGTKGDPKRMTPSKHTYAFDRHTAYFTSFRNHSKFGYIDGCIFTPACSGDCVINIEIVGSRDNPYRLPFRFSEAQGLIERYLKEVRENNFD